MRLPYYILFFLFPVAISCVSTHLDESDSHYIPVTDSDADTDTDTDTDTDSDSDSAADTGSTQDTSISTDSGTDSATNSDSGVADTDSDTETGTAIVVDTATETGTGIDGGTESSMDTSMDTGTDTPTGADTESSGDTNADTDTDTGTGADTESSGDTSVDTGSDTGTRADCTVLSEGTNSEAAGDGCVIVEQLLTWATVLRLDSVDGWTPPISFTWENGCDGSIVASGSETFSAMWQTLCFTDVDANCPTTVQFTGEAAQLVRIRYYSSDDACAPTR